MTPHEEHHLLRPDSDHWEMFPFFLGVVVIVVVGVLVLTGNSL